ncbi:MAG: HNH endonuclease, partial [Spirochaetales bacterium]|nr:HNH endonuclease [Spirochaetales bacterium]
VYGLDEKFVEEWKKLDNWFYDFYKIERIGFEVSNLGRIRYDDIYLLQEAEKYGYLTISKELNKKKYPDLKVKTFSKYVYYYISAGFYGNPNGKCIHHINNNGYDCRPENLILLTPPQHSKVHGFPVKGDDNSYEKVSQVGQ